MTERIMRNYTKRKTNGNNPSSRQVHIEFIHSTASAVAIAGTFNDWRPEATRMVLLSGGRWRKDLVLPPGRYEYLFVADGQWVPDPRAVEAVPNPFGGVNSILRVPRASEAIHEKTPSHIDGFGDKA